MNVYDTVVYNVGAAGIVVLHSDGFVCINIDGAGVFQIGFLGVAEAVHGDIVIKSGFYRAEGNVSAVIHGTAHKRGHTETVTEQNVDISGVIDVRFYIGIKTGICTRTFYRQHSVINAFIFGWGRNSDNSAVSYASAVQRLHSGGNINAFILEFIVQNNAYVSVILRSCIGVRTDADDSAQTFTQSGAWCCGVVSGIAQIDIAFVFQFNIFGAAHDMRTVQKGIIQKTAHADKAQFYLTLAVTVVAGR